MPPFGRALAFATRFEANCRALAQLLHVRPIIQQQWTAILEDDAFVTTINEFWCRRLRKHLSQLLQYYELPEDTTSILKAGKTARNLIAHEITLSVSGRAYVDVADSDAAYRRSEQDCLPHHARRDKRTVTNGGIIRRLCS